MKKPFTFQLDVDLKSQIKEHAKSQKPKESMSYIIHRAVYEYLEKHS